VPPAMPIISISLKVYTKVGINTNLTLKWNEFFNLNLKN